MKKLPSLLSSIILFTGISTAQMSNIGFEQNNPGVYSAFNSVGGSTIESQVTTSCGSSTVWTPGSPEFSIVSTPILFVPFVGILPNSPCGGNKIAIMNNSTANSSVTKLTQTISVTIGTPVYQFAYAGMWQNGGHLCCEEAGLKVRVKDPLGNIVTCPSFSLAGAGCMYTPVYTVTSGTSWTNWQARYVDLTPYTGSVVTVEVTVSDCTYGDHYGTIFFDASLPSPFLGPCSCGSPGLPWPPTTFCPGTPSVVMSAPNGYQAYLWTAPQGYPISNSESTLSSITVTNPLAGNVYTINTVDVASSCVFSSTMALLSPGVGILAIGATPTCTNGASGSATVVGSGNTGGYVYTWLNSNSILVGTTQVVQNLSPGIYSVQVAAAGPSPTVCTAMATIAVNSYTAGVHNITKPFCNSEAYFSVPGGSNYQWYNGQIAVPANAGGTAPAFTVSPANANAVYYLSYTSPQGCRDSLKYTLANIPPGNVSVIHNPTVCVNATNGVAVFSLTPGVMSQPSYSFSAFSTGTATPGYTATLNSSSLTTFTASSLSAGGTYSLLTFDGVCKYTQGFSVTPHIFDYSISTVASTLCPGKSIAITLGFTPTVSQGQYSYTWLPTGFLFGSASSAAIITPTVSMGYQSTLIYSVVVTPSVINCPLTKTLSVTSINPLPPSINPIPSLCQNSLPFYTVSASPSGGSFHSYTGVTSNGVLNPAAAGQKTLSYTYSVGPCPATSSATFIVLASPVISISGNTLLCAGQSTTLQASGANSYSWNSSAGGTAKSFTPFVTASYTVAGTNTITGCPALSLITVSVMSPPQLVVAGDTLICDGETTTLTAAGASSYSWAGVSSQAMVVLAPLVNTTYTLSGSGTSGCTNTKLVNVAVSPCTSITEKSDAAKLRVYPNPGIGNFYIQTDVFTSLMLFDVTGKKILETTFESGRHVIDIGDYPNGIYILKAVHNRETIFIKLVKND